jgi:hypothetical protein
MYLPGNSHWMKINCVRNPPKIEAIGEFNNYCGFMDVKNQDRPRMDHMTKSISRMLVRWCFLHFKPHFRSLLCGWYRQSRLYYPMSPIILSFMITVNLHVWRKQIVYFPWISHIKSHWNSIKNLWNPHFKKSLVLDGPLPEPGVPCSAGPSAARPERPHRWGYPSLNLSVIHFLCDIQYNIITYV